MNRVPLETEEDLQLVREYILLPVLLDVLERDITALEKMQLKMVMIYVKNLRYVQHQATSDLRLIHKKFRERGLKVYEQQSTNLGVQARYLCRGYHRQFSMLWGLINAELQKKLSMYLENGLRSDL